MKALLKTLGVYFLFVAIPRVALFANRFTLPKPDWAPINPWDVLGILFALGLGLGVYVFSYYGSRAASFVVDVPEIDEKMSWQRQKAIRDKKAQQRNARRAAWVARLAAMLFGVADGLFNIAEVSVVAVDRGQIINLFTPVGEDYIHLIAIWIFGLFPTLGTFVTGFVTAFLERVPKMLDDDTRVSLWRVLLGLEPDTGGRKAPTPSGANRGKRKPRPDNGNVRPEFIRYVNDNGGQIDVEQAAAEFGVSKRTIYRWLNKMSGHRQPAEA